MSISTIVFLKHCKLISSIWLESYWFWNLKPKKNPNDIQLEPKIRDIKYFTKLTNEIVKIHFTWTGLNETIAILAESGISYYKTQLIVCCNAHPVIQSEICD